MEEIWKDIPDLVGHYQASSLGRIRSVDRMIKLFNQGGECFRLSKGRILKQYTHKKTGYCLIATAVNTLIMSRTVHRLVALAFHDNPEGKPQVNHKNGIKSDNRASNLYLS